MNKNTHRIVPIEATEEMQDKVWLAAQLQDANIQYKAMLEASPVNSDAYFDAVEGVVREAREAHEQLLLLAKDKENNPFVNALGKALAAYDKAVGGV